LQEKGKALVYEKYTRERTPYKLVQSKKLTTSEEEKLETCTSTQSKRDLRQEAFKETALGSQSSKRDRFLYLEMLIKKAGISFLMAHLGHSRI
jgi:hypothetical protein